MGLVIQRPAGGRCRNRLCRAENDPQVWVDGREYGRSGKNLLAWGRGTRESSPTERGHRGHQEEQGRDVQAGRASMCADTCITAGLHTEAPGRISTLQGAERSGPMETRVKTSKGKAFL